MNKISQVFEGKFDAPSRGLSLALSPRRFISLFFSSLGLRSLPVLRSDDTDDDDDIEEEEDVKASKKRRDLGSEQKGEKVVVNG